MYAQAEQVITETVTQLRIATAEHRVQLGEHSRRIEAQSSRILYGDNRAAELEKRVGLLEQWRGTAETRMDDLGEKVEEAAGAKPETHTKRLEIIIPIVLVLLAAIFKLPLHELAGFIQK